MFTGVEVPVRVISSFDMEHIEHHTHVYSVLCLSFQLDIRRCDIYSDHEDYVIR